MNTLAHIATLVAASLGLCVQTLAATRQADFNGDGFDDLVIAAPSEDFDETHPATGIVHVLYGSPNGVTAAGDQVWALTTFVGGDAGSNHRCGFALAVGDFNDDGFSDLAMGMRGLSVSGLAEAGGVLVLYGSPSGLSGSGGELFHRDDLDGEPQAGANLGHSLAAGDFDGDGHDDLAIGVPGQIVSGFPNAGEVHLIYGSALGFDLTRQEIWNQDFPAEMLDESETGDSFGQALAAGDFDGNGCDDLGIGVPFEDILGRTDCGAVQVLYGRSSGLSVIDTQFLFQGAGGLKGKREDFDLFGFDLAVGNFDSDGRDDLAISVMQQDLNGIRNAGAVHVIYGSDNGLTDANDRIFSQATRGMLGNPHPAEFFSTAVGAADFDGDGRDDLAIGINGDLVGDVPGGSVQVMYGGNRGLRAAGNQLWNQDSPGIADRALPDEGFGNAVTGGDYNGDGFADLAIGVSGEVVANLELAGVVHVLYGSPDGLAANGDQLWHQNVKGVKEEVDGGEAFGFTLR